MASLIFRFGQQQMTTEWLISRARRSENKFAPLYNKAGMAIFECLNFLVRSPYLLVFFLPFFIFSVCHFIYRLIQVLILSFSDKAFFLQFQKRYTERLFRRYQACGNVTEDNLYFQSDRTLTCLLLLEPYNECFQTIKESKLFFGLLPQKLYTNTHRARAVYCLKEISAEMWAERTFPRLEI